jgi:hypothetical protein
VAKGWLRASHRELDPSRSRPLRPWHTHTQVQKLRSGDIVSVEIEIWPSATLFEADLTWRFGRRASRSTRAWLCPCQ